MSDVFGHPVEDVPGHYKADPKQLKKDTKRAIRLVLHQMDHRMRFNSPEELKVMEENMKIARNQSLLGMFAGGGATALGKRVMECWISDISCFNVTTDTQLCFYVVFSVALGSWQAKHLLCGCMRMDLMTVKAGALVGMTIGMFSVRSKLFLDLLTIPKDRSPFACEATQILEKEMPQSVILKEIRYRQRLLYPSHDISEGRFIETEPPSANSFADFSNGMRNDSLHQRNQRWCQQNDDGSGWSDGDRANG